jgi:hypothetical protein
VDGRKAPSQRCPQHGVDLDGDDAIGAARKCTGQDAGAGAEVEDEIAALDSGRANELRCELATAEEVLAAPAS